jgi:hypothetical protein
MVRIFHLPSNYHTGRSHIKHGSNVSFAIDFPHRSFSHQTWSECFICRRLSAQVVPTSNIVSIFHLPSTSRTGRSHIKHGPNISFAIDFPHRSSAHQTWSECFICHRLPTQVGPTSNIFRMFHLRSTFRTGHSHIKHSPNVSFAIDFPHRSFPHQTWSECFICHRLPAQVVPTSNIVRIFNVLSTSRTGRSHIKHSPNISFAIDFPHRSFPHQT